MVTKVDKEISQGHHHVAEWAFYFFGEVGTFDRRFFHSCPYLGRLEVRVINIQMAIELFL
jgi:hypothetical protein